MEAAEAFYPSVTSFGSCDERGIAPGERADLLFLPSALGRIPFGGGGSPNAQRNAKTAQSTKEKRKTSSADRLPSDAAELLATRGKINRRLIAPSAIPKSDLARAQTGFQTLPGPLAAAAA